MPSSETDRVAFLSLDEVVAIHARLIERFGGDSGLRDEGMLESVLYRCQTGYYADLVEMAAALMESLLINHPFVDGNKRVAFFVTDVFLRLNGWCIRVDADDAFEFIVQTIVESEARFERITAWLRTVVESLE